MELKHWSVPLYEHKGLGTSRTTFVTHTVPKIKNELPCSGIIYITTYFVMFWFHSLKIISTFLVGGYQSNQIQVESPSLPQTLLADTSCSTCDSSTVLSQVMDLDPLFAFLLIDVHHIVVGTHCNLCIEISVHIY